MSVDERALQLEALATARVSDHHEEYSCLVVLLQLLKVALYGNATTLYVTRNPP